jgi:A/G-specific adenine glycosylase
LQKFPTELLKEWFLANRRPLPWREHPTPYRVWISEVMLQQTQVAVVIPYFEQWMQTFPTLEALAKAPLEHVLKCWEGLGYYSRARNLHKAASYIVAFHGGEIPASQKELAQIKGIGPYTQGAIRSFAFRQKAAAVDGNVLRVLSRFLAFEEEIDAPKGRRKLEAYAEKILPDDEPWLISEGLIELGATLCTKRAQCEICPLKKECLALRHSLQAVLPKKSAPPKTVLLKRTVAVIHCEGRYLLQKGESGKVMAGLYEFPYLEGVDACQHAIREMFERALGLSLNYLKPLALQQHTFTRFRVQLFPHRMEAARLTESHLWKQQEELSGLPFSSGHRRILNDMLQLKNKSGVGR